MEQKQQISRMYVVVRQDITPGYQLPQTVHAKDKFTHDFPEIENAWYHGSNTIAILGVNNEDDLLKLVGLVQREKLKFSLFFEPDINEYTAVAIEPGQKTADLLKHLTPAGRKYKNIIK